MFEKIKDFVLGRPKAHVVPPQMNRKQRRQQQHMLRAKASTANRKKYEGRG